MKTGRLLTAGLLFSVLLDVNSSAQINFINITDSSGLGNFHENGFGTALLDYDGDDDLDIFVVGQNGLNKMFRNLGDFSFDNVTPQLSVGGAGSGWGVCFGDFDADYDEDIYVSRRDNGTNSFFVYNGVSYDELAVQNMVDDPGGFGYSAFFAPLRKSLVLDLIVVNQAWSGERQSCRFFAGNLGQPFENITEAAGLADSSQYWDCGTAVDYDNDSDLDLLISGESTNRLYNNDGHGILANVSDSALINLPRDGDTTGYGITWGDYDNDGWMDFYISYWHDQHGEMFHNNGDGTFTDVTASLGLGHEYWCHSVSFGDFDNDAWIDIYAVSAGSGNKLYRNNYGNTFTQMAEQAGVVDGQYGCGLSVGDIDRDGKLDMVIGHYHGGVDKVEVYRNTTTNDNYWVVIKVNGFHPNPDAIGARVRLFAGGLVQMREVSGGSGFGSQNMLPLHFGLGTASVIDSVIITYPGAHIPPIKYYDLDPNQIYELPEIIIDLASRETISPGSYHDYETPIYPTFEIANVGNVDVTDFWVFCDDLFSGQRVRIDSVNVSHLTAGDSMLVDYGQFVPPSPRAHYTLESYVKINGDRVSDNDTVAARFYVGYAHDLSSGPILCPLPDSLFAPIIPRVTISNAGVNSESGFNPICLVFYNDTLVYEEEYSYQGSLSPLESQIMEFPNFAPASTGQYLFAFNSNLPGDRDLSNDISQVEIFIPVGDCQYRLGDINDNDIVNGVDILYAVQFFHGGTPPLYICDCPLYGNIYIAGDVNGSCSFNGTDLTFMVNYFKGGPELIACPNCPPGR
jgi:hypothetical protein